LVEQGSYDEAIEECTEAIKLDPNLTPAYNNRAYLYNERGQYVLFCYDSMSLD